jgi:hypothetical protein
MRMQIALLALLTAALMLASRREGPRTRVWLFLRVLFPSFRFFDDAPGGLVLLVRAGPDATSLGSYGDALPPAPLGLGSLWFSAQANLRFAYYALLDQLVSDLGELETHDHEQARHLVSYVLVERLAREVARSSHAQGLFQFQIELRTGQTREAVVTSMYHAIA